MSDLFIGWDVGAWNCDRNPDSRDALCAIEIGESDPVVVGKPWRGNVRDLLVEFEEMALVEALLLRMGVAPDVTRHLTIAIDTPLGWPRRMVELVTNGLLSVVPPKADKNPYLFRAQELALFAEGHRPMSTVRDMIGSQSTKGIHFLKRAGLLPVATGVWASESLVAIETYPAAAVRGDGEVARLTSQLLADVVLREKGRRSEAWQADVGDAITCALVAHLHRCRPKRLQTPDEGASATEGWIWLPAVLTRAAGPEASVRF